MKWNILNVTRVLFFLAVLSLGCEARANRILAENGTTKYRIVTATSPTGADALAARELSTYLTKSTGAEFATIKESVTPSSEPRLYVGATAFAKQHGIDLSTFSHEESLLRTIGNDVIFCGGHPRGALHAVYDFLESEVGCYWLDEKTEIVPKLDVLKIGRLNSRREPAFWYRDVYTSQHQIWPGNAGSFLLRNRASRSVPGEAGIPHNGTPGGCHTFHAYTRDWPDKPELFSLNPQGERDRSTSGSGPGHICVTNPETIELVETTLRQFIAKDRAKESHTGLYPRVYDISQNDNNAYICCCPACTEMLEKEGSYSGPLLHMINQVADGIHDDFPEILVQTFAYTSTQKPPKTIRPSDNVLIRLCHLGAEFRGEVGGEYFRPASHRYNDTFRTYIHQWGKLAKNLAIWDYWVMYKEEFPNPYHNVYLLKDDINLYRKNNVQTVFIECEKVETTSFFALKRWLTYQLLDDPKADDDELIAVFMDGYYGPGSRPMTTFLKSVHRLQSRKRERLSLQKTSERSHWTLDFFIESQALFDRAESACAPGSPELLHVRRERIPLDSALFNLWDRFERKYGKDTLPFDRTALIDRYEAYRVEQMEAHRRKNTLEKGKRELLAEVTKFRERPLIEKRKLHPPPEISIPRIASANGNAGDADWTGARVLDTWYGNHGESCIRDLTAHVAHDGSFLYIRLTEVCNPTDLKPAADIWTGDDWELFFAPVRGKAPYRQIALSPTGKWIGYHWSQPIGKATPTKWLDSGAKINVDKNGTGWTATVAIPLASITPAGINADDTFYANFYRASNKIKEVYAWSPNFESSFHVLTRLGAMTLDP